LQPYTLKPAVVVWAEHEFAVRGNSRGCHFPRVGELQIGNLRNGEVLEWRRRRMMQERVQAETYRAEHGQSGNHAERDFSVVLIRNGDDGATVCAD